MTPGSRLLGLGLIHVVRAARRRGRRPRATGPPPSSPTDTAYGNFDIISGPVVADFSARHRPPRPPGHTRHTRCSVPMLPGCRLMDNRCSQLRCCGQFNSIHGVTQGVGLKTAFFTSHGNFDIEIDHFSRASQLHATPHAPCDMLCHGARADWMLICACDPMLWPIRVFRHNYIDWSWAGDLTCAVCDKLVTPCCDFRKLRRSAGVVVVWWWCRYCDGVVTCSCGLRAATTVRKSLPETTSWCPGTKVAAGTFRANPLTPPLISPLRTTFARRIASRLCHFVLGPDPINCSDPDCTGGEVGVRNQHRRRSQLGRDDHRRPGPHHPRVHPGPVRSQIPLFWEH